MSVQPTIKIEGPAVSVRSGAIVGARRRKKSVWEKLASAYDRKAGLWLTGDDVDTLYLMDTAVRDVVDGTKEQSPND